MCNVLVESSSSSAVRIVTHLFTILAYFCYFLLTNLDSTRKPSNLDEEDEDDDDFQITKKKTRPDIRFFIRNPAKSLKDAEVPNNRQPSVARTIKLSFPCKHFRPKDYKTKKTNCVV